jgi:putative transposase
VIKTSKHNIHYITNEAKLHLIDDMFDDYKHDLITYINYIIDGVYPLKMKMSSKELITEKIRHSKYKRDIYIKASEIIRSQIKKADKRRYKKYQYLYSYMMKNHPDSSFVKKKYSELNLKDIIRTKYFTIPKINNISINLTNEFFDIKDGNHFDNHIKIILPFFNDKGTRALKVHVPLKHHKHSNNLKLNGYSLRNNIQLKKVDGKYYINLIWKKPTPKERTEGSSLGIDLGVNKLLTCSNGHIIGDDMPQLYDKIINKQRNSNNYKQLLSYRDNITNYYVNQLDLTEVKSIIIEDLKNVKYKSSFKEQIKKGKVKFKKKQQQEINDRNARWMYPSVIRKIERMCEERGIKLVKVSPAYTSQTCSNCGNIDKESRKGAKYKCISCGYNIDADVNASINIHNRGVYSSSDEEKVIS